MTIFQNKRNTLLFIGVFALLGATYLFISRAATPSFSIETEDGQRSNGATLVSDPNASRGQAIAFANAAPPPPTGSSIFIAVAGDIASSNSGDTATANLIKNDPSIQAVLAPGDLAYQSGTEAEFQFYEDTWGVFKSKTYPAIGNHEYFSSVNNYNNYWKNAVPRWANSQLAPAAVRENPIRYTFTLGDWQFFALDSEKDIPGQNTWLDTELAKSTKKCVAAFWHSPLLAGSSPTGDTSTGRVAPFWQTLMKYKADLVLAGHEHAYVSFDKADHQANFVNNGIRSFVVGTGGIGAGGSLNNQAARKYIGKNGILKLELKATSYSWQFIETNGSVTDIGSDNCVL